MVLKPYDGTDEDDVELAVMEAKLRLLLSETLTGKAKMLYQKLWGRTATE